jgi:hypothetical protein
MKGQQRSSARALICRGALGALLAIAISSVLISSFLVASPPYTLESTLAWGLIALVISVVGTGVTLLVWFFGRTDRLVVRMGGFTMLLFVLSPVLYWSGTFARAG